MSTPMQGPPRSDPGSSDPITWNSSDTSGYFQPWTVHYGGETVIVQIPFSLKRIHKELAEMVVELGGEPTGDNALAVWMQSLPRADLLEPYVEAMLHAYRAIIEDNRPDPRYIFEPRMPPDDMLDGVFGRGCWRRA